MSTDIETVTLFAVHEIQAGSGRYIPTNEIDSSTGEFKLRHVPDIYHADRCHDFPKALADELLAMAEACPASPCVREPTERELLAHRHNSGLLIERA